jgi:hypothetical protein
MDELNDYCLPTILEVINRLGGLDTPLEVKPEK